MCRDAGSGADDANNKGGSLVLQGGDGGGLDGAGGDVSIDAGKSNGDGASGSIALGTVNAGSITIGNSNSTTVVDGALQAGGIDTSGAGELTIGGDNATSINLGQDTTIGENKTLNVKIPAGVDEGDRIRLAGEGEAGLRGGPATLETARSAYLGAEWSGPADRRAGKGKVTKTEI